jgi:hypothetical protein
VKIIAGELGGTTGPIAGGTTDPYYFDVQLAPGAVFEAELPASHNVFVYPYEGEVTIGDAGKPLPNRAAGLLGEGERVKISAPGGAARALVLAGKPLREPIVQYGPFVMNTHEEIEQAVADYQAGRLSREQIGRIKITT